MCRRTIGCRVSITFFNYYPIKSRVIGFRLFKVLPGSDQITFFAYLCPLKLKTLELPFRGVRLQDV